MLSHFFTLFLTIVMVGDAFAQASMVDEPMPRGFNEKYSDDLISLTADQLNAFRNHLRNSDYRKRLEGQPDPIPKACQFIFPFLDLLYNDSFQNGKRAVFFQINLGTRRAAVKYENDWSGTLKQLPWTKAEVRIVAILVDLLLSGQQAADRAAAAISSDAPLLAWKRYEDLASSPFTTESALSAYLIALKGKAESVIDSVPTSGAGDALAYAQLKTLFDNFRTVEGVKTELSSYSSAAPFRAAPWGDIVFGYTQPPTTALPWSYSYKRQYYGLNLGQKYSLPSINLGLTNIFTQPFAYANNNPAPFLNFSEYYAKESAGRVSAIQSHYAVELAKRSRELNKISADEAKSILTNYTNDRPNYSGSWATIVP